MKKIIFVMVMMFLVIGCTSITEEEMTEKGIETVTEMIEEVKRASDWKDIELKDISTGEMFRISDFLGKNVLIESFAVWCPTCRKQQDEIRKLHELVGDSVVSISIDTDPNEDESKVLSHLNQYGYDWRYAIAPIELTRALINDFGISIVNAPGAPIVLICENGNSRLLPRGVKDANKLKEEINKGCA